MNGTIQNFLSSSLAAVIESIADSKCKQLSFVADGGWGARGTSGESVTMV